MLSDYSGYWQKITNIVILAKKNFPAYAGKIDIAFAMSSVYSYAVGSSTKAERNPMPVVEYDRAL